VLSQQVSLRELCGVCKLCRLVHRISNSEWKVCSRHIASACIHGTAVEASFSLRLARLESPRGGFLAVQQRL
jgi:hypothetical protein